MQKQTVTTLAYLAKSLGGFSALGREFGVSGWAAQKWARSGKVPASRVPTLCDLAAMHGLEVRPWHIRPDVFPVGIFSRR